jgi:hypothetical protein
VFVTTGGDTVRFVYANPNYKSRASGAVILAAAKALAD